MEAVPLARHVCPMAPYRIGASRIAAKLTLEALAADVGVSVSQLSRFESGEREPRLKEAIAIAGRLGVSLSELAGEEKPLVVSGEAPSGFIIVERLQIEAGAGPGRSIVPFDNDPADGLAFREDWLRRMGINPKKAHALTAVGDSMESTIRDGDTLLVDGSITTIRDQGVYVVVWQGLVLVKRVQVKRDGTVILTSDNGRYQPEEVPRHEAHDIHIAGRVRWCGRTM